MSHSLLTVGEVAARLGVCKALVYRACASGELRHVCVGSAVRIAPDSLVMFIARRYGRNAFIATMTKGRTHENR